MKFRVGGWLYTWGDLPPSKLSLLAHRCNMGKFPAYLPFLDGNANIFGEREREKEKARRERKNSFRQREASRNASGLVLRTEHPDWEEGFSAVRSKTLDSQTADWQTAAWRPKMFLYAKWAVCQRETSAHWGVPPEPPSKAALAGAQDSQARHLLLVQDSCAQHFKGPKLKTSEFGKRKGLLIKKALTSSRRWGALTLPQIHLSVTGWRSGCLLLISQ